ncbi:helix-turn-helix domain-containing protein [Bacillus manliponensis]|uniref:helix-turn-helix domain-containing protein n=1 Tax=Bacillus manliponensis TaxID=574376 RepID=UPI0035149A02
MTIVDRVKHLCQNRGISVSKLEEDLDFGKNSLYRWKAQSPSAEKLLKVAEYFNVSVDYLLGRSEKIYLEFVENDEQEKSKGLTDLINKIKDLSPGQLNSLSDIIDPILKVLKK